MKEAIPQCKWCGKTLSVLPGWDRELKMYDWKFSIIGPAGAYHYYLCSDECAKNKPEIDKIIKSPKKHVEFN